jgi:hypothetical protein
MTKKKQQQNKKTADKQALSKKEDNAIVEKMTIEEAKDFINQIAYIDDDPQRIMKGLSEDLLPQIKSGKANKKIHEKTIEAVTKALMIYGLETHYPLAETVNKGYRPLAIEFGRQLIQEFDCKTPSEKALAQIVVNAYLRVIDNSRRYNNCLEAAQYISDKRTRYLAVSSKQLDRANRQFITALTTLKQIKTPSLEINVKTKMAFVAQNQQLNINPSNKDYPNKNENIEPK